MKFHTNQNNDLVNEAAENHSGDKFWKSTKFQRSSPRNEEKQKDRRSKRRKQKNKEDSADSDEHRNPAPAHRPTQRPRHNFCMQRGSISRRRREKAGARKSNNTMRSEHRQIRCRLTQQQKYNFFVQNVFERIKRRENNTLSMLHRLGIRIRIDNYGNANSFVRNNTKPLTEILKKEGLNIKNGGETVLVTSPPVVYSTETVVHLSKEPNSNVELDELAVKLTTLGIKPTSIPELFNGTAGPSSPSQKPVSVSPKPLFKIRAASATPAAESFTTTTQEFVTSERVTTPIIILYTKTSPFSSANYPINTTEEMTVTESASTSLKPLFYTKDQQATAVVESSTTTTQKIFTTEHVTTPTILLSTIKGQISTQHSPIFAIGEISTNELEMTTTAEQKIYTNATAEPSIYAVTTTESKMYSDEILTTTNVAKTTVSIPASAIIETFSLSQQPTTTPPETTTIITNEMNTSVQRKPAKSQSESTTSEVIITLIDATEGTTSNQPASTTSEAIIALIDATVGTTSNQPATPAAFANKLTNLAFTTNIQTPNSTPSMTTAGIVGPITPTTAAKHDHKAVTSSPERDEGFPSPFGGNTDPGDDSFPDVFSDGRVRDRLREIYERGDFSHDDLKTAFNFNPADYNYAYDYGPEG